MLRSGSTILLLAGVFVFSGSAMAGDGGDGPRPDAKPDLPTTPDLKPDGKKQSDGVKPSDFQGERKGDGAKPGDSGGPPCGNILASGCCDGEKLKFCVSGKLRTTDCTSKPKCGWDSTKGYYGCGTAGEADPAAKLPLACAAIPDLGPKPDAKRPTDLPLVERRTSVDGPGPSDSGCGCRVGAWPGGGGASLIMLGALSILLAYSRRLRRRR